MFTSTDDANDLEKINQGQGGSGAQNLLFESNASSDEGDEIDDTDDLD